MDWAVRTLIPLLVNVPKGRLQDESSLKQDAFCRLLNLTIIMDFHI